MNKSTYRMSSAGTCARAISAQKQGYEPKGIPPWLEIAAEEGKWHEKRIVQELRDKGEDIYGLQEECILEYPAFKLIGHIDGKITEHFSSGIMSSISRLLEIKSMSQFEFDRWMKEGFQGFSSYAAQVTCYMEANNLKECRYIVKNRSSGYKNDTIIAGQPGDINTIIRKFTDIENWLAGTKARTTGEVYPADFDQNSLSCKRCFYSYLCAPEQKELTPMEKADLESAAKKWRKGKQLISQGEELVNISKQSFEQHTKATGINRWKFNELVISLIEVESSITYPKENLLKVFTEEELMAASKIKLGYDFIKISDFRKETE